MTRNALCICSPYYFIYQLVSLKLLDFITVDEIMNAFWDPVTALEAYV